MRAKRQTKRNVRGLMPRFETRVLYGSMLVALPGLLALLGVLLVRMPHRVWAVAVVIVVEVITVILARWHSRHVMHPLYPLSSLLEALRQGDYSLRGTPDNVLGELIEDINALAEELQAERLDFEESSYLLGKTLAALDSAVFVFDRERKLRLLNPAGERLMGRASHDLFGCEAAELDVATLLEGPAQQLETLSFPARSGRFDVRHTALRRDGQGGQLLVVNDMGRVLREEERQAWQRLLRVLRHEVNNSLAPIQSMSGTLATLAVRDPLPADWHEDFARGLTVIEKRAETLSRFLDGYTQLARLPAPSMRQVDVAELLHKVVQLESRVPVELKAGDALSVSADADQLEQALINLLRNAAEASAANDGSVRVSWRAESERVIIDIADEGAGPPSSENLFVPFFTTKPGGSGIGLALVRQIVEAHDGEVMLLAGETGGTVARLWLPIAADADSETSAGAEPTPAADDSVSAGPGTGDRATDAPPRGSGCRPAAGDIASYARRVATKRKHRKHAHVRRHHGASASDFLRPRYSSLVPRPYQPPPLLVPRPSPIPRPSRAVACRAKHTARSNHGQHLLHLARPGDAALIADGIKVRVDQPAQPVKIAGEKRLDFGQDLARQFRTLQQPVFHGGAQGHLLHQLGHADAGQRVKLRQ
jgi:signal transduction histidine kinase